jgi:hypothetical protein
MDKEELLKIIEVFLKLDKSSRLGVRQAFLMVIDVLEREDNIKPRTSELRKEMKLKV